MRRFMQILTSENGYIMAVVVQTIVATLPILIGFRLVNNEIKFEI